MYNESPMLPQKPAASDLEYLRSIQGTLSSEWLSEKDSLAYDDL